MRKALFLFAIVVSMLTTFSVSLAGDLVVFESIYIVPRNSIFVKLFPDNNNKFQVDLCFGPGVLAIKQSFTCDDSFDWERAKKINISLKDYFNNNDDITPEGIFEKLTLKDCKPIK